MQPGSITPSTAQIRLFLCLKDNFGVLLHDPATGATAAIDAPEAAPIEAALAAAGWKLSDILVTHQRSHRRHCRIEAAPPLPRRGAAQGGGKNTRRGHGGCGER